MPELNYWPKLGAGAVSRRHVLRGAAVGGAGLAAVALIGCGSKKTEDSGTPAANGTTAAGGAPAVAAPKKGGRLAFVIAGDPPTFDMHGESTYLVNNPTAPGYNQLVQIDPKVAVEKPDGILPDLAESWEISPDGLTYTFKLAQNVKFHDGAPFSSADVKASLDRNQNPPKGLVPPRQDQFAAVKSMETPDANTFVLKLSRPMSPLSLLPILGQGWMSIYAKKDIDANFDFKKKINGTGPYRLTSYERGNRVTFDRNKDYFVKDRPYLDGLDIYIVPDTSTQLANTQSGAINVNTLVSAADQETLKKAMGDKANYQNVPSYGFNCINFNTQKKPWNDPRVRLAISLAISRQDAIKILNKGDAVTGAYLMPEGLWALPQADVDKIHGYETYSDAGLAEAKKLLSAAGVQDGLPVVLLTRNLQSYQDTSLFVADQLAKVGMKAKSDIVETAIAYDRLTKRDFDMVPWGHGYALDDPDAIFSEFYLSKAPRNYSQLGSVAVDDLYMKQSQELDQKKRFELVKDLQKLALPEFSKIIMVWNTRHAVVNKNVKDYTLHTSIYNNARWQDVWLKA